MRPPNPSLSPAPSLRYHNLHPDYIHQRLQSLGKSFALRILLVQVDVVSRGPCPPGSLPPSVQWGAVGLTVAKWTIEFLPRRNAS